jgi:hypothetical protein
LRRWLRRTLASSTSAHRQGKEDKAAQAGPVDRAGQAEREEAEALSAAADTAGPMALRDRRAIPDREAQQDSPASVSQSKADSPNSMCGQAEGEEAPVSIFKP